MIRHRIPHQLISSQSSSSSRLSDIKEYMSRRRCWLGTLCIVVIIVMVIGLAFTAHQYYHDFGGQGWLKARTQHREGNSANIAQVYLPLRQIQRFKESSINERQVGKNVPYYTCGDQQNSCESFSQPVSSPRNTLMCIAKVIDRISVVLFRWHASLPASQFQAYIAVMQPTLNLSAKPQKRTHHSAWRL